MITEVPSCIMPQYLWYNRSIQVDNSSVYFLNFPKKILIMFHNILVTTNPLNKEKQLIRFPKNCLFDSTTENRILLNSRLAVMYGLYKGKYN